MLRVHLEPTEDSAQEARRHIRRALEDRGVEPEIVDDAELLVSELVTNAVLHARTPVTVVTLVDSQAVEVAVSDAAPGPIDLPSGPGHRAGGYGMRLLDRIATSWTIEPQAKGKTVSFRLQRRRADFQELEGASPR